MSRRREDFGTVHAQGLQVSALGTLFVPKCVPEATMTWRADAGARNSGSSPAIIFSRRLTRRNTAFASQQCQLGRWTGFMARMEHKENIFGAVGFCGGVMFTSPSLRVGDLRSATPSLVEPVHRRAVGMGVGECLGFAAGPGGDFQGGGTGCVLVFEGDPRLRGFL